VPQGQERGADEHQPAEAAPVQQPPAPVPGLGEALAVQQAEAIAMLRRVIENATQPLRWPMYVRNVKQLLRAADSSFDERRYGFGGILDLLRASQRDSLLRLERDRQGVLRVFQGAALQRPAAVPQTLEPPVEEPGVEAAPQAAEAAQPPETAAEAMPEQLPAETAPGADVEAAGTADAAAGAEGDAAGEAADQKPKRRRSGGGARKSAAPRKPRAVPAKPRGKKKE
jgi:hypothetical protein